MNQTSFQDLEGTRRGGKSPDDRKALMNSGLFCLCLAAGRLGAIPTSSFVE
jgi:hypothetical protein